MPLNGSRLGAALKAAVDGLGVEAGTPIDTADLWNAVGEEIVKEVKLATITSSGATAVGTPGGPLAIVSLPATIT